MSPRVLVLGGGVAGCAAATLLARGGVDVTLLEQHAEPRHKMCGEFLSTEACDLLSAMGLDLQALGAVPIREVRLVSRSSCISHPLPFAACSLTRRVLDGAMLELASASGAEVRRGHRVESLQPQAEGGWRVTITNGDELLAPDVLCASGKHDLRGYARPPGAQEPLIAFKQYFRLASEQQSHLDAAIELILFQSGYAGLQTVESGCANLCLLVEARRFRELGGRWDALLSTLVEESPHLRRRLRGAEPVLDRPLSLSRIPYGFVRRHAPAPGMWCIGDQAAVIPSFSGDGMSIALHSARVAAETYLRHETAEAMTRRLHRELRAQIGWATALSRLMLSPVGQGAISGAVWLAPSLISRAAAITRINPHLRQPLSRPG